MHDIAESTFSVCLLLLIGFLFCFADSFFFFLLNATNWVFVSLFCVYLQSYLFSIWLEPKPFFNYLFVSSTKRSPNCVRGCVYVCVCEWTRDFEPWNEQYNKFFKVLQNVIIYFFFAVWICASQRHQLKWRYLHLNRLWELFLSFFINTLDVMSNTLLAYAPMYTISILYLALFRLHLSLTMPAHMLAIWVPI